MAARYVKSGGSFVELGGGGGGAAPSTWETLGADTGNSRGTAVTSGSANAKGSWVQLDASLANDCALLVVGVRMFSSGSHSILVDIATGAASSETVRIPNLHVAGIATDVNYFSIPVAIAAGTRIAARSQCNSSSQTCYVTAYAQEAGVLAAPPATVATYGADTTDTLGTSVDPGGGAAHTKGSWYQLTASTSADIDALVVNFGGKRNTARTNASWLVDIGTGGAGSETVVLSDLFVGSSSAENLAPACVPPMVVPTITAGTRLAARAQCSTTDPSDRLLDVLVHAS